MKVDISDFEDYLIGISDATDIYIHKTGERTVTIGIYAYTQLYNDGNHFITNHYRIPDNFDIPDDIKSGIHSFVKRIKNHRLQYYIDWKKIGDKKYKIEIKVRNGSTTRKSKVI